MRNFLKIMAVLFAVLVAIPAISATYTHVFFNDGTNTWAFVSSNSSASSTASFQRNGVSVFTLDPVNGAMVLSSTVTALPACTAALDGTVRFVTNNSGTTVGGTAVNGGAVQTLVVCYGVGAVWVVG